MCLFGISRKIKIGELSMKVKIFSGTNIKVLEDKVNKFGENVKITDIKLSSATDDYGHDTTVRRTILVMYEEKDD